MTYLQNDRLPCCYRGARLSDEQRQEGAEFIRKCDCRGEMKLYLGRVVVSKHLTSALGQRVLKVEWYPHFHPSVSSGRAAATPLPDDRPGRAGAPRRRARVTDPYSHPEVSA